MVRVGLRDFIRTGCIATLRHPFRAFLSMASLAVGIGAVIVIMALGEGARVAVINQMLGPGANAIFINPGGPVVRGVRQGGEGSAALTVSDAIALSETVTLLKWTCWTVGVNVQAVYGGRNWKTRVVGITPQCLRIRNWSFVEGGPFIEDDLVRNSAIAIVGQTVVEQLFGPETEAMSSRLRLSKLDDSPGGIKSGINGRFQVQGGCMGAGASARPSVIDGKPTAGLPGLPSCSPGLPPWSCMNWSALSSSDPSLKAGSYTSGGTVDGSGCAAPAWMFEVVGVLEPKGVNAFGYDADDVIYVPFSTAMRKLKGLTLAASVEAILGSTEKREEVGEASDEIRSVLRERHRIKPGESDDFTIKTDVEMSGVSYVSDGELIKMLVAIAALSLLGAGIGIMNILLVSVTARTREIGVRMAVGAKRRHILMQFLIEAMTLSVVGGMFGILFGVSGARLITVIAGWPTMISGNTVAAALLFSLAVGLFFGLYPANKAARLNPIDALRYE